MDNPTIAEVTTEVTTETKETPAPEKQDDLVSKKDAEIARLGKLVNQYTEEAKKRSEAEQKAKDEEAKKRGEFEKLFNEKSNALESIAAEKAKLEEQTTMYNEFFSTQYQDSLKWLKEDQKQLVENLLEGKSEFEKAKLAPDIIKQFGGKTFWITPKGDKRIQEPNEAEDLLKKWDFIGALEKRFNQ